MLELINYLIFSSSLGFIVISFFQLVEVGLVVLYNVPTWPLRVTSPSLISPSFFAVSCSEPSITRFSSLFPY